MAMMQVGLQVWLRVWLNVQLWFWRSQRSSLLLAWQPTQPVLTQQRVTCCSLHWPCVGRLQARFCGWRVRSLHCLLKCWLKYWLMCWLLCLLMCLLMCLLQPRELAWWVWKRQV